MLNVGCLEPPVSIDRSTIRHWDGANF
jgi:hypothetical protein